MKGTNIWCRSSKPALSFARHFTAVYSTKQTCECVLNLSYCVRVVFLNGCLLLKGSGVGAGEDALRVGLISSFHVALPR